VTLSFSRRFTELVSILRSFQIYIFMIYVYLIMWTAFLPSANTRNFFTLS